MEARSSDRPPEDDRALTMKERAKKARHEAYLAAKERRKNDPRTAELKAKLKAARREASAQAKARRKADPKQIALKEKLKQERRAASALAREQRKTQRAAAKSAERADKDDQLRLRVVTGGAGEVPQRISGKPSGGALAEAGPRRVSAGRPALTVIEGGKSAEAKKRPFR
jgi:membrane protein involved in colicin uptake